jgi:hypothetical protein
MDVMRECRFVDSPLRPPIITGSCGGRVLGVDLWSGTSVGQGRIGGEDVASRPRFPARAPGTHAEHAATRLSAMGLRQQTTSVVAETSTDGAYRTPGNPLAPADRAPPRGQHPGATSGPCRYHSWPRLRIEKAAIASLCELRKRMAVDSFGRIRPCRIRAALLNPPLLSD